jgi:pimeloyl-ACP methyl ester carboxylesterase
MATHAEHCALLMRELGIGRAHVVGHSSSAVIALQLALDFPDTVASLVLMEPARPVPPTPDQAEFVREVVAPAIGRFRAGDPAGAVDTFARGVFGPGYREPLERGLPGAIAQAVADAGAFFAQELPALQRWEWTAEDARRVTRPVLAVRGERSVPTFAGRLALLESWLPDSRPYELPGATHLLHVQEPGAMASALAAFFARHPAAVGSPM